MSKLYAGLAAAAVVGMVGGLFAYGKFAQSDDQFAECRGGAVGGDIGGPFTLQNAAGKMVTDKDVITKPSLVYFGYTFCPDVCPLDNARNAEAIDILEERGFDVNPIFITVDPARDTPDVVGDFAANLHPKMIGLTGTEEQVKVASQAYKTFYRKQNSDDPEFYLVDHSTFTYLVLPETGFVDFFKRDDTAEQMAERTACFLSQ